jgi:hypothetical protein
MALTAGAREEESESLVSAIEDMVRLTAFLDTSLDVAEGKPNALKLNRVPIDLEEIVRVVIIADPFEHHSRGAQLKWPWPRSGIRRSGSARRRR